MEAKLFITKSIKLESGMTIPDIVLRSGECVWVEYENPLVSETFIAFMLGLIKKKKGKALLCSKELKNFDPRVLSFFDITSWAPSLDSTESLLSILACHRGLKLSKLMHELRRILEGLDSSYILNLKMDDMMPASRRILSTAVAVASPSLLSLMLDPFEYLENAAKDFLKDEIQAALKEGSSFMMLSNLEPKNYDKHVNLEVVKT